MYGTGRVKKKYFYYGNPVVFLIISNDSIEGEVNLLYSSFMKKTDVYAIVVYHSLTHYSHSRLYEHKRTIQCKVQINEPKTFFSNTRIIF